MIKRILAIFQDSSQSFQGQEAGEKVILLLRKHRFVLYMPLGLFAFACLVPIVVYTNFSSYLRAPGIFPLFLFVASIWYIVFWTATFYSLTLYTLNVVIVTNKRIIESEQRGFFNRKISELHVHRIQDISVHTNGMIETFLQFGDIVVQTAASERQFTFNQIANPEIVKDTIMQIVGSQFSGIKPI
ncbi:MAG: PH domain-containing protein [bacterium]|nr:PH domain-containing protein [bacterium]